MKLETPVQSACVHFQIDRGCGAQKKEKVNCDFLFSMPLMKSEPRALVCVTLQSFVVVVVVAAAVVAVIVVVLKSHF